MKNNIILLSLCLLFAVQVHSSVIPVTITDSTKQVFLSRQFVEMFEDSGQKLTIEDIAGSKYVTSFTPLETDFPENSNENSRYWLRFSVNAAEALEKQFLIESFTFKVNELRVFVPNNKGRYKTFEAGNTLNFSERGFMHKNFQFMLGEIGREPVTIYVSFKTEEKLRLMLVLRTLEHFTAYALNEYFLLGLFYGIILIIAIYNLFLFINIKEKAYLFYVFYVLSVGFYAMAMDGTGFQYLWPEFPGFNKFAAPFFQFFLIVWLLMYCREFLPIRQHYPIFLKFVNYFLIFRSILLVLSFTLLPDLKSILLFDLVPFFLAYIASVQVFRKNFRPARFFIAGFSLLFFSFLINGLMYENLVPANVFTVYSVNIGVVAEMILLSVAIAERVRLFREEKLFKEQENKQLEQMVKARTMELEMANQKLQAQAKEIAEMNMLLSADNVKLEQDVKRISENRVLQHELNFEEFSNIFPDEETCFKYLSDLKWEKGYHCSKCGNDGYSNGKSPYSRRCSKCGYDESASAYTLFHSLKFPITKAFYMLFLVTENPEITVEELSEKLSLTVKTAWSFKKKIAEASAANKGRKGRKKGNKWAVLILQPQKLSRV